jgi:hypothetical protein
MKHFQALTNPGCFRVDDRYALISLKVPDCSDDRRARGKRVLAQMIGYMSWGSHELTGAYCDLSASRTLPHKGSLERQWLDSAKKIKLVPAHLLSKKVRLK